MPTKAITILLSVIDKHDNLLLLGNIESLYTGA